ncbi:MAG: hypothetical protein LUQ36_07235, partial [Methanoregula sp.]|nr:hypothetical protein [Methanoregula sp.]
MIITQLNGGLGNQMFQYAAGRSLAFSLNTELKLDISQLGQDTRRNYNLSVFSIKENIVSDRDLKMVRRPFTWMIKHPTQALESLIRRGTRIRYVKESQFHFDPEIPELPDNVYLEGYWQSEKYFKKIEPLIRQDFRLQSGLGPGVERLSERIGKGNAISIHFRRGDFISNQ